jgi:AP-3 complex subunit delta-1
VYLYDLIGSGCVTFYSVVCVVKYLGLLAMSKILKTHPKSVQAHKDLILQCLDDKDESIRLRALDLLYGMVRWLFAVFVVLYLLALHDCATHYDME